MGHSPQLKDGSTRYSASRRSANQNRLRRPYTYDNVLFATLISGTSLMPVWKICMQLAKLVLLVVDDDSSDLLLIERAFRQNGINDEIHCLDSGPKAIAYLKGEGEYADRSRFPYPSLVMTDLKMPGKDGFSVLEHIKDNPQWQMIRVLVLSGSDDTDDVKRAYCMGASCYLKKPTHYSELRRLLRLFYDFWKECQVPEIDVTGKQLDTDHIGKLGERFGPAK